MRRRGWPRRRRPDATAAPVPAPATTPVPAPATGTAAAEPAARAPDAERAPGPGTASDPVRALRLLGALLAPTTVVTALLWYFGRRLTGQLMWYLGVDHSVMSFSTQDYLVRSADALFLPLAGIAAAAFVLLAAYRLLASLLTEQHWQRLVRWVLVVMLELGIALVVLAAHAVLRVERYRDWRGLQGLCLAAGVALLQLAVHTMTGPPIMVGGNDRQPVTARIGVWLSTFTLVSIGLFWAVQDYASAVGIYRGQEIEAGLTAMPDAVLFSGQRLNLGAPGVHETTCADDRAAYRYRYDGLRLIIRSGDQYLLLPADWTFQDGEALVLQRGEGLRMEFSFAALPPDRPC